MRELSTAPATASERSRSLVAACLGVVVAVAAVAVVLGLRIANTDDEPAGQNWWLVAWLVVGSADPVGLSRLARGLVELRELTDGAPVHVVVNRMRPSLGWSEKNIAGMVTGFARLAGLYFLPDDRGAVDRALVAGRTLVESGDSPLVRALARVVDALTR